jgi:hypothetical protein
MNACADNPSHLNFGPLWTEAEDEIVRREYKIGGAAAARRALPHRSANAISQRAIVLNVSSPHVWSERDEKLLVFWWESGLGIAGVGKHLTVKRSVRAIYLHAQRKLKLPVGAPPGWEHVQPAANRLGVDYITLVRICAWADVEIRKALSWPGKRSKKYRQKIVETAAVDEAFARWLKSETPTEASRRHGISAPTMRIWLRAAGAIPPTSGINGKRERVDAEIVDRVVAERRTRKAA